MRQLPNDIFPGVDRNSIQQFLSGSVTAYDFLSAEQVKSMLPLRDASAHKNDFGHACIIAGSEGKGGAAILSTKAALRTGCGLVTAMVPANVQQALLVALPEAMTLLRKDAAVYALDRFDAIGFGPGVGMDAGEWLLQSLAQQKPMVIDADGLTLLSQNREWYRKLRADIILTPHAGEFDRLTQTHPRHWDRIPAQTAFAKEHNVIVLLKGHYTSIAMPDGRLYFNTTGNNGMATAGSGDVLTGIITSLLAQGCTPADAALAGAYIHGAAGDIAAGRRSRQGMIASDIIEALGDWYLGN